MTRPLRLRDHLALESIAFQNGIFFAELAMVFRDHPASNAKKLLDDGAGKELETLIKKHTGLCVNITLSDSDNAAYMVPPILDKNNVLFDEFWRYFVDQDKSFKKMRAEKGRMKGSVSLVTGQASGIFSEIPAIVNMPVNMFGDLEFTAEEAASVILHEVGHFFVYLEYLTKTMLTNQALAGIAAGLSQATTVEERTVVLVDAKELLGLKKLNPQDLAKEENVEVCSIVVIRDEVADIQDELGADLYNVNSWEYLADQYAMRMGAGRHLVIALDKIHRRYGHISYRSTGAYVFCEAVKFMMMYSPYLAPVSLLLILADTNDETYDRPEARFQRMRLQIVEQLKDRNLPPVLTKSLIDDLAAVDMVMSKVHDRRQWISILWGAIFGGEGKKRFDQEQVAKELEELASSDFFVHHAKLKQTATLL